MANYFLFINMFLKKNESGIFRFLYDEKYQLRKGLIFSLALPLLILSGHIIQINNENIISITGTEIGIFFTGLGCWFCFRFIMEHSLVNNRWLKVIFLSFLCLATFAILYKYSVLKDFSIHQLKYFPFEKKNGLMLNRLFLLGFMMLSLILFLESLKKSKKEKEVLEQLIRKNLTSQMNFLRQQINPHFLFNALNILQSGAKEDWVKDYVIELSKVYRYLLSYNDGADLTLIATEMEFLDAYIHILKERFEEGLIVNIIISPEAKTRTIPVLSLQILVENAVKHNVVSHSRPLHITIYDAGNYLIVTNNRQAKRKGYNLSEAKSGLGLHNLKERYRLIANDSIFIEEEQNNFTVKLPMI